MLPCMAEVGKTLCLLLITWVEPESVPEGCKAVAMETMEAPFPFL